MGVDKFGNKYFENVEELPRTCRSRAPVDDMLTYSIQSVPDGLTTRSTTLIRTFILFYPALPRELCLELTVVPTSSAHIEPLWHSWISYAIDTPPNQDPIANINRPWANPNHVPNLTFSRGAFKTYSTYVKPYIVSEILGAPLTLLVVELSPRSRLGNPLRPRDNRRSERGLSAECTYALVANRLHFNEMRVSSSGFDHGAYPAL